MTPIQKKQKLSLINEPEAAMTEDNPGRHVFEKCPYLHLMFPTKKNDQQKHDTILHGLLHPRPLASRTDVIPKVHDSACDVISSHSKEGHLGGTRLQCNSEQDGDDE